MSAASYVKVLLRNVIDQMIDYSILINDRQIQKEFRIIIRLLEKRRKDLIQGVALLDEQKPEDFVQLVVVFQLNNGLLLFAGKIQICVEGRCDQARLYFAIFRGKHTDVAGQIVIDLHKAYSNQTVEPCVRNLLDDVLIGRLIV